MSEMVDKRLAGLLASSGGIREAVIVAVPGDGYEVRFKIGNTERPLRAKRGEVRRFKNLDTVAKLLRELKITQFTVDQSHYKKAA